ncbi:MAG: hydroxyacylglutathione hydrolase [Robiginitomaculum sp.]|nr:MAG: hydroxyacylglutathione hydrolase [Robiginitomaculum sp.]
MISLFPCLNDNYGFLLVEPDSGLCATIDTPDGAEIDAQLQKRGLTLTHILNTHHHYDHVGGNQFLKDKYGATIVGPKADAARIPGIDIALAGGEVFKFGAYDIHIIDTPGHTLGHCAYYVPDEASVFVGDTIFVMGCGRLFEGTPAQMFDSLSKLAALHQDTKIYCAHEYTLSNAAFAVTAEPDNNDLKRAVTSANALRDKGQPTVPTTVGIELKTNPFMRAKTPEILGEIRAAKDKF